VSQRPPQVSRSTRALRLLLPHAREEGLTYVELTTDADHVASQRVIEANGGTLVERFHKPRAYGGAESLRFRILLSQTPPDIACSRRRSAR
jgi:predicted acetyltransferase